MHDFLWSHISLDIQLVLDGFESLCKKIKTVCHKKNVLNHLGSFLNPSRTWKHASPVYFFQCRVFISRPCKENNSAKKIPNDKSYLSNIRIYMPLSNYMFHVSWKLSQTSFYEENWNIPNKIDMLAINIEA